MEQTQTSYKYALPKTQVRIGSYTPVWSHKSLYAMHAIGKPIKDIASYGYNAANNKLCYNLLIVHTFWFRRIIIKSSNEKLL